MTRRMNMGLAIKNGLEKAREKGIKPGQKKLFTNKNIQLILKLRNEKRSLRDICDVLFELGIKNPYSEKKFSPEAIRLLLLNVGNGTYSVNKMLNDVYSYEAPI